MEHGTCVIPDLLSLRHLEANSCWRSDSPHAVQEDAFPTPTFSSQNQRNGCVQELALKAEGTRAHFVAVVVRDNQDVAPPQTADVLVPSLSNPARTNNASGYRCFRIKTFEQKKNNKLYFDQKKYPDCDE